MKNKKSGVDAASVAAAPAAGRTFTSGDICQLTGIPYRALDFWARSGFAAPHISAAQGIGTDRLYSLEDLWILCLAWELRKAGLSPRKIKRALEGPASELLQAGGTWLEFPLTPHVTISVAIEALRDRLEKLLSDSLDGSKRHTIGE